MKRERVARRQIGIGRASGALLLGMGLLGMQLGVDLFVDAEWHTYSSHQLLSAQTAAQDPRPKRNVPPMTAQTFEKISKFNSIVSPEVKEGEEPPPENAPDTRDLAAAKKILDDMLARSRRLNENELAQIHRAYAWLASELEDTDLAIHHLSKVLEYRESITYGMEEQTLNNLSVLYFSEEQYDKSLDYALQWTELAVNIFPPTYAYVAQIYYALEDYEQVKVWVRRAMDKSNELMRPIKEHWWRLLLGAHSALEEYRDALEILRIVCVEYPTREYWLMMARTYSQLEEEKNSGYVLELASLLGVLDRESDYTNLASRAALSDAFIRAVWIFEEGLEAEIIEPTKKNYKTFAQYLHMSREADKAIDAYRKAAEGVEDEEDGDGRLHHLLALLFNETERYRECIEATDTAIELGGLKNPNQTLFLKGVCQFSDDQLSAAKESFEEVERVAKRDDDESTEKTARQYIDSIDVEFQRIEYREDVERMEQEYREEKAQARG